MIRHNYLAQRAEQAAFKDHNLPPEARQFLATEPHADSESIQIGERQAWVVALMLHMQRLSKGQPWWLSRPNVIEYLSLNDWRDAQWYPGLFEQKGIIRCVQKGNPTQAALYEYIGPSYKREEDTHAT